MGTTDLMASILRTLRWKGVAHTSHQTDEILENLWQVLGGCGHRILLKGLRRWIGSLQEP